jgi:hypothetical protein
MTYVFALSSCAPKTEGGGLVVQVRTPELTEVGGGQRRMKEAANRILDARSQRNGCASRETPRRVSVGGTEWAARAAREVVFY